MNTEWNQKIRDIADSEYVRPAKGSKGTIKICQGELYDKARRLGLPAGHANQVGTSIESPKFWKTRTLEMLSPKNQSRKRTTIYEFRFREASESGISPEGEPTSEQPLETPSQRAFRLTEAMRGLLKEEIAAFGGSEAFMRWVRSDEEEDVA